MDHLGVAFRVDLADLLQGIGGQRLERAKPLHRKLGAFPRHVGSVRRQHDLPWTHVALGGFHEAVGAGLVLEVGVGALLDELGRFAGSHRLRRGELVGDDPLLTAGVGDFPQGAGEHLAVIVGAELGRREHPQ